MRKWLCFLLSMISLTACQTVEKPTLHLFYYETCPNCALMETEVYLPAQERYGDRLNFEMHDLDQEDGQQLYASFMGTADKEGELADVAIQDRQDYYAPLLVLEGYYAIMGYSSYFQEDYLTDIERALNGEDLSPSLQDGRWYFRKDG